MASSPTAAATKSSAQGVDASNRPEDRGRLRQRGFFNGLSGLYEGCNLIHSGVGIRLAELDDAGQEIPLEHQHAEQVASPRLARPESTCQEAKRPGQIRLVLAGQRSELDGGPKDQQIDRPQPPTPLLRDSAPLACGADTFCSSLPASPVPTVCPSPGRRALPGAAGMVPRLGRTSRRSPGPE